ncbi:hypothetical protein [Alishewanella sp. HL-SH05]|uniref:hypothetical protein n=1 Tax=Alishewanella sp. HL-SH05 TaxID=3461145 RepID=UPI004041C35E
MLSTKWIVLGGCLLLGNLLSGCTALGMLGDSQLRSDNRRVVQDQQTGQSKTVEPPLLLTELGIALDSAVIEGVKKLGKDEQPKKFASTTVTSTNADRSASNAQILSTEPR